MLRGQPVLSRAAQTDSHCYSVFEVPDEAMGTAEMLVVFAVVILCCCQVEGRNRRRDDDVVSYTHPETCFPVETGLVNNFTHVNTTRRLSFTTTFSGQRTQRRLGFGFRPLPNAFSSACFDLDNLLFRTADGSCNNQLTRGQSLQPLGRLLPPAYSDGVQAPRNSSVLSSNLPLPGARLVSRTVHPDKADTTDLTIFVMQWGQFMDHEMVSTPLPIEDTRGIIRCCGPNKTAPLGNENSECFPIRFPAGDPNFKGTCMDFVRSQPVNDSDGNIRLPRENQNLITSFIDASTVYGSTKERLEELKDSERPYLLRATSDKFPPDNGINDCVQRSNSDDSCFLAGDDRVNEQPGLTLLHVVFLRYHNFLANQLKYLHRRRSLPNFLHLIRHPDELIFQQARAIVEAVMQNILYSEWLPIVLGPNVRRKFDLDLVDKPRWLGGGTARTQFNETEDPSVFTAFSTAVFRFGHTLIPRSLPLAPGRRVLLRELFFKPFEARENLDTLVAGLVRAEDSEDRTQPTDQFIVSEVTGHLFENQEGEREGFDLVGLNIQRGRDHGIPPYNDFREKLGLRRLTSFQDPALGTAGDDLQSIYDHVNDIDLFSGGIAEPVFDGGIVGETFSNLMAMQFKRLKFGDRFFFTHNRFYSFTDVQVNLIRQIRLAHVLCLTTNLADVQLNVFRVPAAGTRLRSCQSIRRQHPHLVNFLSYIHPFSFYYF